MCQESDFTATQWKGRRDRGYRELGNLGHAVKPIASRYARSFVKRQKNDAVEAEAIVVAAQCPEIRFVVPKTEDRQAEARFISFSGAPCASRTERVNALRAILYEHGHHRNDALSRYRRRSKIPKRLGGAADADGLQKSRKSEISATVTLNDNAISR